MKASLEFYSKSGAHAISGTEGTLTPESPLAFLVLWMRALQLHREPKKQFMDLGRIIPRVFRMRIVIKFDTSIPIQKLRARLCTAFHGDDTFARVAQPLMDRRGTRSQQQRSLRCQLCLIYGHDASTCKVRSKRVFPKLQTNVKKRQKSCTPLIKADDGSRTQSTNHHQFPQNTSHRTADASSDRSNCRRN
ncbi:surface protease GP63 [Trypanosoma cruzi]|nr:surface protease GP63 [Trypanosoma cruzi]